MQTAHKKVVHIRGLSRGRAVYTQQRHIQRVNMSRPANAGIEMFDPDWFSNEQLGAKIDRLDRFYDDNSCPEIIWAESGGAALALALAERRASEVKVLHLVCGFACGPDNVLERHDTISPHFKALVGRSGEIVSSGIAKRIRIITHIPLHDGVVPDSSMRIESAEIRRIPMVGHVASIAFCDITRLPRI